MHTSVSRFLTSIARARRSIKPKTTRSVFIVHLNYFFLGVTVTIDVKHSRTMGRQYLNVLYAPTVAYKGHTEGLCGFMDNNATNDFMGPNGEAYEREVQFAESCTRR